MLRERLSTQRQLLTWIWLAAVRALRSSLRAAMPLYAACMVTAEAVNLVPLAPCSSIHIKGRAEVGGQGAGKGERLKRRGVVGVLMNPAL